MKACKHYTEEEIRKNFPLDKCYNCNFMQDSDGDVLCTVKCAGNDIAKETTSSICTKIYEGLLLFGHLSALFKEV